MKKYFFIVLAIVSMVATTSKSAFSHHPDGPCSISGKVVNQKEEPLVGASVYWAGTTIGTSTGTEGDFTLSAHYIEDLRLVASFVGHLPDTILIELQETVVFVLHQEGLLEEVVVRGQRSGVVLSSLTPVGVETITAAELQKSACCDLAGCFETQTSVQPHTTNIVTNAKELRILGLSGVYNQILVDGLPTVQGLSQTYGISSIPGTLVQNIHVTKGSNSVLQGFESISGQIVVETLVPETADKFFLNLFSTSDLERQLNAQVAFSGGEVSNLLALHTVQPGNRTDRNDDNFLDLPLLTRYSVFNKTSFGHDHPGELSGEVALRFLKETRVGGQFDFEPSLHNGGNEVYGQSVSYNQYDITSRTSFQFSERHNILLLASAFHHKQGSFFGTTKYDATQLNVYANLQHEFKYGTNNIKSGISFRYSNLDEDVYFTIVEPNKNYDGRYLTREVVPGVFVENTLYLFDQKMVWLAGARADLHNNHGLRFTPRTLVKIDITPQTVLRASIGKGWRTTKLFSENINLMASSRNIVFEEELEPEEAINYGVNFVQKFESGNKLEGFVALDFYKAAFQNQVFPDYDRDPTKAFVGNFRGKSSSLGLQAEVYLFLFQKLELKTGYNYLDVHRVVNGQKQALPFISKHRLLQTAGFSPRSGKYRVDLNLHWYGKQRLPNTSSNPVEFQRPGFSEPYTLLNAQFTIRFNGFEIYTGAENLLDFRQNEPIISWQDPFGPYFDTSFAWGPTRGREFYIGLRMKVN